MNVGSPEGSAVPVPLVSPVMLLLNNQTGIIWFGNRIGHHWVYVNEYKTDK